jgi:hypothetical protein
MGVVAFAVAFVLCGAPAQAQHPAKVARIGILSNSPAGDKERIEGFVRGLPELGWTDGNAGFLSALL